MRESRNGVNSRPAMFLLAASSSDSSSTSCKSSAGISASTGTGTVTRVAPSAQLASCSGDLCHFLGYPRARQPAARCARIEAVHLAGHSDDRDAGSFQPLRVAVRSALFRSEQTISCFCALFRQIGGHFGKPLCARRRCRRGKDLYPRAPQSMRSSTVLAVPQLATATGKSGAELVCFLLGDVFELSLSADVHTPSRDGDCRWHSLAVAHNALSFARFEILLACNPCA